MTKIAKLLNIQNMMKFEAKNLFWKIGPSCDYLQLSLILANASSLGDIASSQYVSMLREGKSGAPLCGTIIDT